MFHNYAHVLMTAVTVFPLIAALITFPYVLYNYHKHGSILSLRIVIVYSFILYLLCTYFLVILPLPTVAHVAHMTGPTMQLEPFKFIHDIARGMDGVSGISGLLHSKALYQTAFNVLMTVPFGIYLRYYFRCGLTKTIFLSFCLSLFFELTQLSGLYFLYPRGYRLFDADDLITNTSGGLIGYIMAAPLMKILPSRRELDRISKLRSRAVSAVRRLTGLICDAIFLSLVLSAVNIVLLLINIDLPFAIRNDALALVVYYAVVATLTGGHTVGGWITRTAVRAVNGGRAKRWRIMWRYVLAGLQFVALPYLYTSLTQWLTDMHLSTNDLAIVTIVFWSTYAFMLLVELIRLLMHRPLLYERLSRTRLSSTIEITAHDEVDERTMRAIDESVDNSDRSDNRHDVNNT